MHGSTGGNWKRSDLTTVIEVERPAGKPRVIKGFATYRQVIATAPAPDPTCATRVPVPWAVKIIFWSPFCCLGRSVDLVSPGWAPGSTCPVMGFGAGRWGVWPGQVGCGSSCSRVRPVVMRLTVWCVRGQVEPGSAGAAGDAAGDGEQSQAEPFGFPHPGVGAGQGEHLHPGGQFGGEHDDRDPDLILREVMQGKVSQAGVLRVPDPVLAAGAAPVPQFQVRELPAVWCSSRTR